MAYLGVLFLDEIAEFSSSTLEALRQPIEAGEVSIARVGGTLTYPCRFTLVAAMNPCPCGYHGTPKCSCKDAEVRRYRKKISGPILDRIDLQVQMRQLSTEERFAATEKDVSPKMRVALRRPGHARWHALPERGSRAMQRSQAVRFATTAISPTMASRITRELLAAIRCRHERWIDWPKYPGRLPTWTTLIWLRSAMSRRRSSSSSVGCSATTIRYSRRSKAMPTSRDSGSRPPRESVRP